MYPSIAEIEKLHRKYAPNDALFDLVFTHCKIVWELAETLIHNKNLKLNKELVHQSAFLHDIGSYKYLAMKKELGIAKYYKHALAGATILRMEGIAEEICAIVEYHLGAGLTLDEIKDRNLDLPLQDFLPQTIEERLVLYADKFHSKTPKFNTFDSYREYTKQFGHGSVQRFESYAEEFGIPDLIPFAKKYHYPIL